ncbi:hypothetical protein PTE30175_04996 [Pandoraea terrae]|uniref:Uncharacterized protein n=1 Tax=Pandoraea terrae TaxID=1537710 RepID=A0A5E4Z739_9BURK|nr:hypothetical protein PTE30175_04996 [Pandoraea terrae]
MIIGNTKQSTPLPAAFAARSRCIGEVARSEAAATEDRRGASPGRGGWEGGGERATAAPLPGATATISAQEKSGQQSAAIEALLHVLIGQHMHARMTTQASR